MEHVKSLPYVGENYGNVKPFGLSVLILGESHYIPGDDDLYDTFTREIIRRVLNIIDGPKDPTFNTRFFTKVARVFHDKKPDQGLQRQFWQSVVYYVFIQESVGKRPRIRPTDQMWRDGGPALQEVLIEYEPEFVLVLGKQLWSNLPIPLETGPLVTLPNGQSRESRLYFNDAGSAFTFGINHPSSGGWNYGTWTPWVKAALETAIKFHGDRKLLL